MAQKKITDLQLIAAVTDSLNIPSDDTLQSYRFTALQMRNYILNAATLGNFAAPGKVSNALFAVSVGSSAATIALKTLAGANPSATDPVYAWFDNGDGTVSKRSITAALSVVIPSTATLGHPDNIAAPVYVYLVDNSGTISMAVSSVAKAITPQSVTAIGTGSDDSGLYGTALTTKPIALVGVWISTQTTAGTWASATGSILIGVPDDWFPPFYSEIIPTSFQNTASADTWTNAESSPTLVTAPPGLIEIGLHVTLRQDYVGGGLQTFLANVALATSGGTIQTGTIAAMGMALDASYAFNYSPASRRTLVTLTAATSFKLMVRSNKASGAGLVKLLAPSDLTGLTNPDNHSLAYVRRIG